MTDERDSRKLSQRAFNVLSSNVGYGLTEERTRKKVEFAMERKEGPLGNWGYWEVWKWNNGGCRIGER